MKKIWCLTIIITLVFGVYTHVYAIPTLQLGLSDGSGGYADYIGSLTDPTESDTAIASGSPFTLLAAGVYGNHTLLLGGQYDSGDDWSDFGFDSIFDGKGAVIMATVPQANAGSLTIGGASAFFTALDYESGFDVPNPPSNHDPIKDFNPNKKYLFFNIGDFCPDCDSVPNFADETGSADGEIKSLIVETSGFDFIHFDVFALETIVMGGGTHTSIVTNTEGNPGSHDVTWKETTTVPEPGTILLLGAGLAGLGFYNRKRSGK